MRVDLEQHSNGILLPVKAQAGSRRNAITGVQNGQLKVSVTQVPERGKANQAILKLLCKQLELRKSQISLVTGETSPLKQFLIEELTQAELRSKLELALGPRGNERDEP